MSRRLPVVVSSSMASELSTDARISVSNPSGKPSRARITVGGSSEENRSTKSNAVSPSSGSSRPSHTRLIRSSSPWILRGVKARLTSLRSSVCSGGSRKMNSGIGTSSSLIMSSVVPNRDT